MEIPKSIQKKLEKRCRLAEDLMVVSTEVDAWLEKQGIDLMDEEIRDAVLTGCMIYCEPANAERIVEEYVKSYSNS